MSATADLTYSGELTIVTCWCGVKHAVPIELRQFQLRQFEQGKDHPAWCPHGHRYSLAGKTDADRLRDQLVAERARHDQTKAALKATERSRSAIVGQTTKLKKRIAAGVCPCCHRSFANLHRHMEGQHPEYAKNPQKVNR